jgi:hypothetical protein
MKEVKNDSGLEGKLLKLIMRIPDSVLQGEFIEILESTAWSRHRESSHRLSEPRVEKTETLARRETADDKQLGYILSQI